MNAFEETPQKNCQYSRIYVKVNKKVGKTDSTVFSFLKKF